MYENYGNDEIHAQMRIITLLVIQVMILFTVTTEATTWKVERDMILLKTFIQKKALSNCEELLDEVYNR